MSAGGYSRRPAPLRAAAISVRATGSAGQEARCQREASKRGLLVTRVYRDAPGGRELARPGLDAPAPAVRAGAVQAIVVDSPGRLSRDAGLRAALLADWERAGAALLVAGAPDPGAP